MRRLIEFPCRGDRLMGSLDEAPGRIGLLIVSGGNEIRAGAHRGMAILAQRVAAAGAPVFRFDRRGVGDSTGTNLGFANSAEDIAAAAATFTAEAPQLQRVVAFGNCDAATALALFHHVGGINALLLANPWVIEQSDALPPAAAIRARYAERLKDPRQLLRLVTGGVNPVRLVQGLVKLSKPKSETSTLAARMAAAMGAMEIPVTLLLASRDNTAIAFAAEWKETLFDAARAHTSIAVCDTTSHSFAHAADKEWLFAQVIEAIERVG